MSTKKHWENIYIKNAPSKVGWYQEYPTVSLKIIENSGISPEQSIIDIGGGASCLVDCLIDKEYKNITVLDLSEASLKISMKRLGKRAENIQWCATDITSWDSSIKYNLWHDRAMFHFLTSEDERKQYINSLNRNLLIGGHLIIATFAPDGPPKCSGLNIVRYDADKISSAIGNNFKLLEVINDTHITPGGIEQKYLYFYFKRNPKI
ncbi:MAG: class I SAM-dependent methyltransferase [candidate division Zixibacteria bacterium]|nr:class I SAM-dependent methyltransferase [candidate division Zixibacteria bacterium]